MQGVYEWRKFRDPEPEGDNEIEETESEEVIVEARASWWISAAVIAAVALLLIFYSLVRHEYTFSAARETRFTPAMAPLQNQPVDR
jgi:purine-nucleoside phosphorylase